MWDAVLTDEHLEVLLILILISIGNGAAALCAYYLVTRFIGHPVVSLAEVQDELVRVRQRITMVVGMLGSEVRGC